MEYLLKSSALIFLFYACYKLFLQRETFFTGNRWFLLLGLIGSVVISLIVIPIYVEIDPIANQNFVVDASFFSNTVMTSPPEIESTFDFLVIASFVYWIGVVFFLGKFISELVSLALLIKRNASIRNGIFNYIETDSNLAPFSFFNWIFYNPNQFDARELNLIINHEKVHVRQFHSVDVIISQLACIVFWFNPFIWLYKKALQQNLEFIADKEAQFSAPSDKSYQTLLLKTSIPNSQIVLTNNFYNSLIKKRIVMLHTSKSNKMNAYKYALILPLLAVFVFNFNTEIVAQSKTPQPTDVKIGQNVLKYVITKDTKDKQLESIKEKMAENEVTIIYKNLERNDRKEIIGIRIEYDSKKGSGEFFVNSSEPIKDIAITLNVNENTISVGQAMKNLSQSFKIISEDGDKKVKTSGSGDNVFVFATDDDDHNETTTVVGKDGDSLAIKKKKNVYIMKSGDRTSSNENDSIYIKKADTLWIKRDVKNIIWTDEKGNTTKIDASTLNQNPYNIYTNDKKPLFIIDGIKTESDVFRKINPNDIENLTVLKDKSATALYGKEGENGVIIITTKNANGGRKALKAQKNISDEKSKESSGPWEISPTMHGTVYDMENDVTESFNSSYIDKNSRDKDFETIKKQLKTEGVDFKYSKLKRNKNNQIIRIQVEMSTGKGSSKTATFTDDDGISSINLGIKGNNLFINSSE